MQKSDCPYSEAEWYVIKKLRSAYNHGLRNDETKHAANQYIKEMRRRKRVANNVESA